MSVEVVKNIENNRVLIKESSGSKRKPIERYYAVSAENSDKFVSQKKMLNSNRKFQKVMTYTLSALVGVLVGAVVKFGTLGKILSGVGVGAVALLGSLKTDDMLNKKMNKAAMENYNAEDVTDKINSESIKKV